MSKEFKRVGPGEQLPQIPRGTYNAMVDTAEAHQSNKDSVGAGEGAQSTNRAGTVYAYNASTEDAPWRGICEISDTSNTNAQVEFVKPGASDGVGQYGIILQPIKSGSIGEIALSGGPWEVKYADSVTGSDVVAGYGLGPEDGSWYPVGGGVFIVQRKVDEDNRIAKCAFIGSGGILLVKAAEDMTEDYDNTDETTVSNTTYSANIVNADGSLGTSVDVIRRSGVQIKNGQIGLLAKSGDGLNVFILMDEELRTDDPINPEPGRRWVRTDLIG